MRIDSLTLIRCGLSPSQAKRWAPHVDSACSRFDIDTPARLAAWVGQIRVESADFTQLEEGLWYTSPERLMAIFPSRIRSLAEAAQLVRNPKGLANRVYSNRLGNGDEASNEGWMYRGAGLKQLTGKDNFRSASKALGRPYVEQPDLVRQDQDAALTAAWFWAANGCNDLADAWNLDAITRKVNGPAMLKARDRAEYAEQAMREFRRTL